MYNRVYVKKKLLLFLKNNNMIIYNEIIVKRLFELRQQTGI